MASITDIKALRPELLDKSDAELERLENEIKLARQHKAEEAARKQIAALVAEVNAAQDSLLKSLTFLHEQKVLPDAVAQAYMTAGGSFAPHLKHRQVDADRMLRIKAEREAAAKAEEEGKPKKVRQARKPRA